MGARRVERDVVLRRAQRDAERDAAVERLVVALEQPEPARQLGADIREVPGVERRVDDGLAQRDALVVAEDLLRRLKNGDKTVTESVVTNALKTVRDAMAAKEVDADPRVFPSVESFPVDDRGLRTIEMYAAFALQGLLANSRFSKSAAFNAKALATRAKEAATALHVEMSKAEPTVTPLTATLSKKAK